MLDAGGGCQEFGDAFWMESNRATLPAAFDSGANWEAEAADQIPED